MEVNKIWCGSYMNILYIDTRDNNEIIVRLKTGKSEFVQSSVSNNKKAQNTLPLIQSVLKKAKISPSDIQEIKVESSRGSFTGLRIGVSVANALSFGALAKINGKKLSEIEIPQY